MAIEGGGALRGRSAARNPPTATERPAPGYALALVTGGRKVGFTRRGETHWGVVAGHFCLPFRHVMDFEEFLVLVLPAVEEEPQDAARHAMNLQPSLAKGYMLDLYDRNLFAAQAIARQVIEDPLLQVEFINGCSFNDPTFPPAEAEEGEPTAEVISLAQWRNSKSANRRELFARIQQKATQ